MSKISFSEFRKRYEPNLSRDLMRICKGKELLLNARFIDKEFVTQVLDFDLDEKNPSLTFRGLEPREGNQLAKKKKEIQLKFDFMYKGLLYHARCISILWDMDEDSKTKEITVYGTPFLDIKLASEMFKGIPSPSSPIRVDLEIFNKEESLAVTEINIQGVSFEDRMLSNALPSLKKINQLTLQFSKTETLDVPGQFVRISDAVVGFKFDKLDAEAVRVISNYIEGLYQDFLKKKAEQAKAGERKAKRPSANSYKILMLTNDDVYFKQLVENFQGRDVRLVQEKALETFNDILAKQNWELVLIDGTLTGMDLWQMSREMKQILDPRGNNKPHLFLLSDDMSEDALVYAQYCGFEHIYARDEFLTHGVSHVGEISGHHDWVNLPPGEKSVVIIDDDKNVTFTLQHALSSSGYHPFVVRSGKDGVRAAKMYRPVCVIIDPLIRMGDAKDALRVMKRMPYTRDIPIIVLTMSKEAKDIEDMRQLKVDKYLNKPMDTEAIVNLIKEYD